MQFCRVFVAGKYTRLDPNNILLLLKTVPNRKYYLTVSFPTWCLIAHSIIVHNTADLRDDLNILHFTDSVV